jgi:hypothetical protein
MLQGYDGKDRIGSYKSCCGRVLMGWRVTRVPVRKAQEVELGGSMPKYQHVCPSGWCKSYFTVTSSNIIKRTHFYLLHIATICLAASLGLLINVSAEGTMTRRSVEGQPKQASRVQASTKYFKKY